MNPIVPMYVYSTNFVTNRAAAIKDHFKNQDRGASLVEYAGLIVLAAIILGLLYAAVNASGLQTKVTTAINNLLSGQGSAPAQDS